MIKLNRNVVTRYRQTRNVLLDLKGGQRMWGLIPSSHSAEGAVVIQSSDYGVIKRLFSDLIGPDDVLVDVGCGKGRVVAWWHKQYPTNKKYGLELEQSVAEEARAHFADVPEIEIRAGDAVENLPADATLLYLYNPFDGRRSRAMCSKTTTLGKWRTSR